MSDCAFNVEFAFWLAKQNRGNTAFLIGLRTDESINRFRAITGSKHPFKGQRYSTRLAENLYNFYPLYDWSTQDIWVANAKFDWEYNPIYDLFYKAGLEIDEMRVASAFNDCAKATLYLYRVLDPDNWGKMLLRVNGVDFTAKYGHTHAMAWRSISLPKGHTWESYLGFLLNTLPEKTAGHFKKKFETSLKFWKHRGGALGQETIEDLRKAGIEFANKGKVSKQSPKEVLVFEKYPDDAPIKDFKNVPSYKRMCICILKNDYNCKYMGFSPTKEVQLAKQEALEKYKNL
ncbi:DUF3440 domain-containing protein [Helicobacter sp. 11S03491-1]|uniref:DUF3440 domain-containing protein n=1 Tax=Helicobacter sp. 11S03491-1 TaxID=1476196 RepID=UPI000BA72913|nr:DUF3440 domain-containing protein [Helicobacter sp. 11S03491-1]PAF41446.1 hypothetical protein BKH45_06910 [Helicobacter sp. 11S03491-1]